jgi:hypothetical protein
LGAKSAAAGAICPNLDVQQIIAREFGLLGNEGKARFGLGAHQPLDRIGGARTVSRFEFRKGDSFSANRWVSADTG